LRATQALWLDLFPRSPLPWHDFACFKSGNVGTNISVNLKLHTDFALRTLLYLAHCDRQTSVEEIATAYGISRDHLFKVVQQLVRLGYIVSRPGRKGGIRLAKDASLMNVATIVGQLEGRNGVIGCIPDPSVCVLEPGCVLRSMLIKAEEAFYETLGHATIADLIKGNASQGKGGVYNLTIRRSEPTSAAAGMPS
jgi:Rrf2 family nitric oxide-sensitive transcriptional repressor